MKKIRHALIGLGRIASSLEDDPKREKPASHAGAVIHSNAEIICGADPDEKKCAAFSERWQVKNVFSSADELLRHGGFDILHICTPPETHRKLLSAALKAGCRNIICEKPLAADFRDAVAMQKDAKKYRARVLINHERRYAADYRQVKSHVEKETYGKLISIQGRLFMGRTRSAAAMLLDDGTHILDIVRFLCGGEISKINCRGDGKTRGGVLQISFKCKNTACSLEIGGTRDHIVFELDLSFERGRIRVGNGIYEEFESAESPYYAGARSLKLLPVSFTTTGYFSGMIEASHAMFLSGETPVSSIEDALAVMRAIAEVNKKTRRF